jgi:hypothetical protein
MADIATTLLLSATVKETCCSSEASTVGKMFKLQRHQILGKRLCLVFTAKSLRFKLTNHRLGRALTLIHGSESKRISGLY